MVNPEMFKGSFAIPQRQVKPLPQPVQQSADPEVEKMRLLMLKWLTYIVGGAAILLIVWRIVLKFL